MQRFITNFSIKRNRRFSISLFCLSLLFLIQVNAQTLVTGRVTVSRYPVKNASVIFIDNIDTSRKYTALTDISGNFQINLDITSIKEGNTLPKKFELEQNYPNPFASITDISYGLNKGSNIQITIYDILGRVVKNFDVGQQSVGTHNIIWDGSNNLGQRVASGVYFYRLNADGESKVKKMIFNQHGGSLILPHSYSAKANSFSERSDKMQNEQGNTFIIRIQNTSSTVPRISAEDFENVVIHKDTTIALSLSSYVPVAALNFDSLHQVIRGFGAANIVGWRPDMTDSEITTAFGTGDGQLGFTILRLRIPPDSTQWSSNVPTAKKAYDMGAKVFATPWTPPALMKTDSNIVGGALQESSYPDFANYLKSFYDYMNKNGIPLYAISIQNEPDISVSYESCDWNASQFLNFCKNDAQNIGTKVMMPESFHFDHSLSDPTLKDSVAASHVSIIGGHIYGSGLASYPLAESKGKEVWMTEHYTDSKHSADAWPLALDVGTEMQGVMKANMNAYIWWYIVRFYGPIGDGETSPSYPNEPVAKKGEITKRGYVMSQFSRFIRPGYYRVESSVYPSISHVEVTAYKDPSSSKIIIVAVNSNSTQAECFFRIQSEALTPTFTPYTTSESKNCEKGNDFNVSGDNFTYTMEPSSIITFVSK